MGFLGGGGGDVAYVRIQNRSSKTIHITFLERENVADDNLDSLSGEIDPKISFPKNGGSQPFPNNANYASLKGTDGPFNAGRMVVEARVPGANKPTSTLTLIVNNGVWRMEDATPDFNSPIRLVADVNEEKDGSGKEFWKVELRVYDNCDTSKWMELLADKIDDMPLNRVGLPGTHDSGTFTFDKAMGASPDSDLTKTIEKICMGIDSLSDGILGTVFQRLCQCQSKTVVQQLQAGVRYLDLRIARHAKSGKFYTCHGVYCADMSGVMKEIDTFLTNHPKEIVILDFNHFFEMDGFHGDFLKMVFDALGEKAALPKEMNAATKVKEFWAQKKQAFVIYHQLPEKVKDLPGSNKIYHNGYIHSPWPEANGTDVLYTKLKANVASRNDDKHKSQIFVLQGMLTPDVELIKNGLMKGEGLSIKSYASRASPKVVDWCEDEWMKPLAKDTSGKRRLNVVIVDFIEGGSIIPAILEYNKCC